MSMERHRCKLCCKIFSNGRALGGHMRSHLASLPIPPPKKNAQLTESDSSSTRELEGEFENDDRSGTACYELRENPKRSVKALDPEFLDVGSSVVQDRESETESTQPINPTRRRSKRSIQGKGVVHSGQFESKKLKLKLESGTESAPVSSVSDASRHTDEEGAFCLMMLSRDVWVKQEVVSKYLSIEDTYDSAVLKPALALAQEPAQASARPAARAAKYKCMSCKKVFRTGRALAGHKASNRECCTQVENDFEEDRKIFECPFCYKVFGSGQALGGHKRSHLLASATATNNVVGVASSVADVIVSPIGDKVVVGDNDTMSFVLDLNLPAPLEDDHEEGQAHTLNHTQLNFVQAI